MRTGSGRLQQQGAVLLWALILLLVLTVGLGRLLDVQATRAQREAEAALLWTGEQYRQAIASYYHRSPGTVKQLPRRVEDLLTDPRYLTLTRHLRRPYLDPQTGQAFAEIRNSEGLLVGVRSTSLKQPLKTEGFPVPLAHFARARTYNDWSFVFVP